MHAMRNWIPDEILQFVQYKMWKSHDQWYYPRTDYYIDNWHINVTDRSDIDNINGHFFGHTSAEKIIRWQGLYRTFFYSGEPPFCYVEEDFISLAESVFDGFFIKKILKQITPVAKEEEYKVNERYDKLQNVQRTIDFLKLAVDHRRRDAARFHFPDAEHLKIIFALEQAILRLETAIPVAKIEIKAEKTRRRVAQETARQEEAERIRLQEEKVARERLEAEVKKEQERLNAEKEALLVYTEEMEKSLQGNWGKSFGGESVKHQREWFKQQCKRLKDLKTQLDKATPHDNRAATKKRAPKGSAVSSPSDDSPQKKESEQLKNQMRRNMESVEMLWHQKSSKERLSKDEKEEINRIIATNSSFLPFQHQGASGLQTGFCSRM